MEKLLREEFGNSTVRSCGGGGGGGCISSGSAFAIDDKKVFVKSNSKAGSKLMFEGEYASLEAIDQTSTVKVPKPVKVFGRGNETHFVMEYLELSSLRKYAAKLGEQLANMHMYNRRCKESASKTEGHVGRFTDYIDKFGFDVTTCCGFIPMNNEWKTDWIQFYSGNRLLYQINHLEVECGDRDAKTLWPHVVRNIPKCFPSDIEIIPSLLHGDLWGGNAGEVPSGPCVYDPASYYGDSEFELSIAHMFGGFPSEFFKSYHALIPKSPGFEKKQTLYKLFHYLNHWNHFGSGYKGQSISLMNEIARY